MSVAAQPIALTQALAAVGFTELEAIVYADLVRRPGQTGYALAKRLGKGQPSIYSALASLETKGAIHGTNAAARTYSAIPPADLIARARLSQIEMLSRAEEALSHLRREGDAPSSLLRIDEPDQIFARAERMIEAATDTLLFEFTPPFGARLKPKLEVASKKGVSVSGLVMGSSERVEGARNVISPVAPKILEAWPFAVLILVVDGRQSLIAGLGSGTAQGLWSDSNFLSIILNNALASDILLQERMPATWAGPNLDLFGKHPPGFAELMAAGPGLASGPRS
ncbi:MAG: TrmB family transcriptional regulator [Alphaproteobacteria bacterium]|nr:MAG: TrmB family transcriptional regulator [Alphaproteobacteria bacterium]